MPGGLFLWGGSALGAVFSSLVTPGFLPTVKGQPHRGVAPPKPALWARPQLGKRDLVCLCVASLTLQLLLQPPPQHLHRRRRSCCCFCPPSCLLILIRASSDLSVRLAFCLTCLSSHLQLLQVFRFLPDLFQIIKHLQERRLDYLRWRRSGLPGGSFWTLVCSGCYLFRLCSVRGRLKLRPRLLRRVCSRSQMLTRAGEGGVRTAALLLLFR